MIVVQLLDEEFEILDTFSIDDDRYDDMYLADQVRVVLEEAWDISQASEMPYLEHVFLEDES